VYAGKSEGARGWLDSGLQDCVYDVRVWMGMWDGCKVQVLPGALVKIPSGHRRMLLTYCVSIDLLLV
jgi:hypothetical protein